MDAGSARKKARECGLPAEFADLSVFRVALHQPGVAVALHGMLDALLFRGVLDARLRELIIMRVGWSTHSVYEWTQHWRVARLLNIPEQDLLAVRDWERSDRFDADARAVLSATDDVVRDGVISPASWAACVAVFEGDDATMVELVAAIANWSLFSTLLKSLDVPLEDGVSPWPPDGVTP
ncbi:carboxymuconolactone decarboxylase family protein [Mycolicibacterium septicum DSM 44393]|uniref:Carboxymuconolactone decarboxylase family protein n=2 Tax=Mycobacteriaceae TaxID=1762 RepID=A0A7X6MWT0_9MYCO|nr:MULTISPECIES: carboxymuconolactone decarboxylase family protein [Mycolicibacterium]MBX8689329.1 carboxymuconolactone decarboxylase family protein [Mycobacterium sp. 20091114027_K0903767]MCP3811805.1 carboxymuconolactone decarboxylase family protein [Mycobacteriaceae bacterium Msp059]NKZ15724.1 carboxymuconolactone decarboxylase family protein [Mycolicibacterium septicum DSM 44393]